MMNSQNNRTPSYRHRLSPNVERIQRARQRRAAASNDIPPTSSTIPQAKVAESELSVVSSKPENAIASTSTASPYRTPTLNQLCRSPSLRGEAEFEDLRDRQTSSRAPPINQQKSSEHYFSNDSQAQVHLGELPIASIQEKHLPPSGENAAEENLEGYLPDLPRGVPWVPQETKVCHSYPIQAKTHQHGGKASMRCALTATGSSQHRFRLQQNMGCKTQSQVASINVNRIRYTMQVNNRINSFNFNNGLEHHHRSAMRSW